MISRPESRRQKHDAGVRGIYFSGTLRGTVWRWWWWGFLDTHPGFDQPDNVEKNSAVMACIQEYDRFSLAYAMTDTDIGDLAFDAAL